MANLNIGVFVRTFMGMEEKHIQRFIESHSFADTIYAGTCQTSPKTLEILSRYANVKTRDFYGIAELPDGTRYAHESLYYKFLDDWSREVGVDFVILDDADHWVNPALQRDARHLIESSDAPFVYTLLMYLWGTQLYFPDLNNCIPSERLWGWNLHQWTPDIGSEQPFTVEIRNQPDAKMMAGEGYVFPHPPYCLLHASFLTEEDTRRKMEFNHKRGVPQVYPPESCGPLELLPDWAVK